MCLVKQMLSSFIVEHANKGEAIRRIVHLAESDVTIAREASAVRNRLRAFVRWQVYFSAPVRAVKGRPTAIAREKRDWK